MPLTDDLSDNFFVQLVQISGRLGCAPKDLLAIMASEGGVRADALNPASNASGLIQFMPSTLTDLGWTAGDAAFRQMNAEQQLPWVERYFQPYKSHGLNSVGRLYEAVFLPASLNAGSTMDTVVCGQNGPFANAYANNRGVDTAGKGAITVQDLCDAVNTRATGARWNEIIARLNAMNSAPVVTPPPVQAPSSPASDGMTRSNAIAASFENRGFAEGEGAVLDARAELGIPATAKSVLLEVFRGTGRIEIYHGDGHYAGQVGWGGQPYLQLRVDLDSSGRCSLRGFETARVVRLGALGYY